MKASFPERFSNSLNKNLIEWTRNKIVAECNYILSDGKTQYLEAIKTITNNFLSLLTPKAMDSGNAKNVTILFRVQFGELCAALQSNGCTDPEAMTVFRFYAALKYFESKKEKGKQKNDSQPLTRHRKR